MHCFSDASKSAYGTILYLRFVTCNNEIETSFICSKSRVAPLKSLTLPRLELTAALLSARLAKQVSSCLKLMLIYIIGPILSFRTTGYAAILQRSNHTLKIVFKRYNCSLIRCSGDTVQERTTLLISFRVVHLPSNSELCSEELEHRSSVHVAVTQQRKALVDINRFSSLKKLLKTTAWVFRFVNDARNIYKSMDFYITADEMQNAEYFWLKCVQSEFYSAEILALKQNEQLRSSSEIKSLVPHLEENNLLRLTGRLLEADFF
ncbi:integrase catalytic domain-containing protein [Trichonephila clavipes]|uniref:Integrase catalytic domain-containing protein n=1 Tax=Trichonephila clavipes TaxID=2585209 RepID=A0A8X6VPS6_TRICX|nr:integrase catalytic domain-containing protein [Trichonephila clavipes]